MQWGEIWWASLLTPEGAEPGFRRPVLILQANEFNRSKIATVIVAAITSNLALAAAPGNVLVKTRRSGLTKDSVINISQVLTLNKSSLTQRVKSLDAHTMNEVVQGIRLILNV